MLHETERAVTLQRIAVAPSGFHDRFADYGSLSSALQENPDGIEKDSSSALDSERPADASSDIAEVHDCGRRKRSFAGFGSRLPDMCQPQRGGKTVHQKRGRKVGI
jgi:hypothetical protein